MIVIFVLSTSTFSSKKTAKITDLLSSEIDLSLIAHVIVYFILGFLVSGAVNLNIEWKNKLFISVLACLLYAAFDEIHQYFEPERKWQLITMIIDSISSLLGILFYYLAYPKLLSKDKLANL